jgi:hypothetical protein
MAEGEMRSDEVILHLTELRLSARDRGADHKNDAETRIECKRIVTALTIAIEAVNLTKGMKR